jgi:hypothetical protein
MRVYFGFELIDQMCSNFNSNFEASDNDHIGRNTYCNSDMKLILKF